MADYAGACYGVTRALDLTRQARKHHTSVQTLGPLIHNPKVVKDLADHDVHVANDVSDIISQCVVIRSHGVTPEIMDQVHQKHVKIVNATCPFVMRAQKAAARLGRRGDCVIVVGEAHHPEVQGLVAWAKESAPRVIVASKPEDLPADLHDPIGVVTQTTQTHERLFAIIKTLQQRGLHPDVKDTICSATSQRQDAAKKVASNVDAMIVIGGHNSSNTTRLFEICKDLCPQSFHIEDPHELSMIDFHDCTTIGVTAGASTPDDQIHDVVSKLESLEPDATRKQ